MMGTNKECNCKCETAGVDWLDKFAEQMKNKEAKLKV